MKVKYSLFFLYLIISNTLFSTTDLSNKQFNLIVLIESSSAGLNGNPILESMETELRKENNPLLINMSTLKAFLKAGKVIDPKKWCLYQKKFNQWFLLIPRRLKQIFEAMSTVDVPVYKVKIQYQPFNLKDATDVLEQAVNMITKDTIRNYIASFDTINNMNHDKFIENFGHFIFSKKDIETQLSRYNSYLKNISSALIGYLRKKRIISFLKNNESLEEKIDYILSLLPQLNIVFQGHGNHEMKNLPDFLTKGDKYYGERIIGLTVPLFQKLLLFFNTVSTHTILFISCFAGGYNKKYFTSFIADVDSVYKKIQYPFVLLGQSDSPVSGDSNFIDNVDDYLKEVNKIGVTENDLVKGLKNFFITDENKIQINNIPLMYLPHLQKFVNLSAIHDELKSIFVLGSVQNQKALFEKKDIIIPSETKIIVGESNTIPSRIIIKNNKKQLGFSYTSELKHVVDCKSYLFKGFLLDRGIFNFILQFFYPKNMFYCINIFIETIEGMNDSKLLTFFPSNQIIDTVINGGPFLKLKNVLITTTMKQTVGNIRIALYTISFEYNGQRYSIKNLPYFDSDVWVLTDHDSNLLNQLSDVPFETKISYLNNQIQFSPGVDEQMIFLHLLLRRDYKAVKEFLKDNPSLKDALNIKTIFTDILGFDLKNYEKFLDHFAYNFNNYNFEASSTALMGIINGLKLDFNSLKILFNDRRVAPKQASLYEQLPLFKKNKPKLGLFK